MKRDQMNKVEIFCKRNGYPRGDLYELPSTAKRFPMARNTASRFPSTEGPKALAAVLEAADEYGVTIHRVSQGSGIWMLRR